MTLDPVTFRRLEETALTAWPALEQILYDGWILRFAAGFTKRANSVTALYASHLDLGEKISRCEAAYEIRDLPVIFRITPCSSPDELDRSLAQRGYASIDRTLVMTGTIGEFGCGDQGTQDIRRVSVSEWVHGFAVLRHASDPVVSTLETLVSRIPVAVCPILAMRAGAPAGCALGVADGNWAGLFNMFVSPSVRRSGLARRMMREILGWAASRGAQTAYLQVEADNAPALALYREFGLTEAYPYWYRVRRNE